MFVCVCVCVCWVEGEVRAGVGVFWMGGEGGGEGDWQAGGGRGRGGGIAGNTVQTLLSMLRVHEPNTHILLLHVEDDFSISVLQGHI